MENLENQTKSNTNLQMQISRDVKRLNSDFYRTVKAVDKTATTLQNELEDVVYGPRSENTMHIGKESVISLIELKKQSDKIISIAHGTDWDFKEDIDFTNAFTSTIRLTKIQNDLIKITKCLKKLSTSIKRDAGKEPKTEKNSGTINLDTTSSTTASDFSFMNSNIRLATSSPLPNN